jgi:deazaflavin-dependent oxidoreductase (nitroreductase family)
MQSSEISPVKDALRTFNKHVLNPAMLLLAGRKHWYAAVIRHSGRRSGKSRATSVVAEQVADGFIIPLPYGTGVDWLRNARAAGKATITVGGRSFDVVDPRIIDATTAAEQLPARQRRTFARFGVEHFVKFAMARDAKGERRDT